MRRSWKHSYEPIFCLEHEHDPQPPTKKTVEAKKVKPRNEQESESNDIENESETINDNDNLQHNLIEDKEGVDVLNENDKSMADENDNLVADQVQMIEHDDMTDERGGGVNDKNDNLEGNLMTDEQEVNEDHDDIEDNLVADEEGDDVIDEFHKSSPDYYSNDSDTEDYDTEAWTAKRIEMKERRHSLRNNFEEVVDVCDLNENKIFIEDFIKWLKEGCGAKAPTVALSTGLLFRHDDSYLRFQTMNDPNFNLGDLIAFSDKERFKEIKHPRTWVDSIGKGLETASRRSEVHKAHKRLRKYVLKKLGDENQGNDLLTMCWRDKVRNNLQQITDEVDSSNTWDILEKQIQQHKKEVDDAKAILNPSSSHNELNAVRKYFESQEFLTRAAKHNDVWQKAMKKSTIGNQDFNQFSNFVRHVLAFSDRCRQATYTFPNSAFFSKQEVWFPPNHNQDSFDGIPEGFNIHAKPDDGRAHDAWIIKMYGHMPGMKNSEDAFIVVLNYVEPWLRKFRDLKDIKFGQLGKISLYFSIKPYILLKCYSYQFYQQVAVLGTLLNCLISKEKKYEINFESC